MEKKLKKIVEEAIENREDLFLIDVKISGKNGPQKISILIDGDHGIGIDDCSQLSRKISSKLDEEDLISDKFILEVSSPGVDSPLKTVRQYHKNIGRSIKLTLNDGKELKGELLKVGDASVSINAEIKKDKKKTKEIIEVPFNNIKKAKVLISF